MLETLGQPSGEVHTSRLVTKSPIFYGWIITLVGTLGVIMSSPGQTYSVSIFLEHFIEDLGVSRSLASTLYMMGTLIGSLAQPFVGRQIDRRGPRLVVVVVSLLFGLACIYMGFVTSALMLGLGFIAIRMLGQGSLEMVSRNVINQWWIRQRGLMMGLSGTVASILGLGGFPILITWLISVYEWRLTYILLGLLILLIMVPAGLIFFRDRPEDYGLLPDGSKQVSAQSNVARGEPIEENWTLSEAIHTPIFWVFLAGLVSISMVATGLFFHMVSIFQDNGLSPAAVAAAYVPIAVTTAVVRLGSGTLVGRVRLQVLLATALLFQATSLVLAQFLQGVELAFLYGVFLGATMGLSGIVGSVCWAAYFGRQHLGAISGFVATSSIIGSAVGPMPLGVARDLLGSYTLALTVYAMVPLVLAGAVLLVGEPHRRS